MSLLLDETVNFSICFSFSFKFFLHLLCISLVPLIFPYSAQKFCSKMPYYASRMLASKNRLLCSKFCLQNLSKPNAGQHAISRQKHGIQHRVMSSVCHFILVTLWCGRTDVRSRDYYATTKISWLDRLPNFLSNGAPLTR